MTAPPRLDRLVLRWPYLAVSLGGLVLTMALLVPAYLYTAYREDLMERRGITTGGVVVAAEPACSGDTCQLVAVSYVARGERHLLEANTEPNDPRADTGLRVGQRVEVRYDPAAPGRAQLVTLGASDAGFFRFMLIFCGLAFGIPTLVLGARVLRSPQGREPPIHRWGGARAPEVGRAPRRDTYRLPDGGTVIAPDPLLPLAFVSGLGLLAMGLFVTLTRPEGQGLDPAGTPWLVAVWILGLACLAFFASRSLAAGPGWLATRRGLGWHVVHADDVTAAPPGNALDALVGQGPTLRLYTPSTRIDIGGRQLACPEIRAAVGSVVEEASGLPPESRAAALGLIRGIPPEPSYHPRATVRKLWQLAGVLGAICLLEAVLLLR